MYYSVGFVFFVLKLDAPARKLSIFVQFQNSWFGSEPQSISDWYIVDKSRCIYLAELDAVFSNTATAFVGATLKFS